MRKGRKSRIATKCYFKLGNLTVIWHIFMKIYLHYYSFFWRKKCYNKKDCRWENTYRKYFSAAGAQSAATEGLHYII